jgi:hypothetical protein
MGLFDSIFGKSGSSDTRTSSTGTKFRNATRGRVIIERPGYKPSIGHPSKETRAKKPKK